MAGAITSEAADKAARFMQLCDAFGLPVVSLVDTPGMMVGPKAEATALVRHTSRLLVTGAALRVPFVAVVLRRGYGLGAQAMVAGSLHEPLLTVAWPTAHLGPMGLEGAVRLGFRKELEAIADEAEREQRVRDLTAAAERNAKALNAATLFELDDVIDPAETRGADRVDAGGGAPPGRAGPRAPLRRHLVARRPQSANSAGRFSRNADDRLGDRRRVDRHDLLAVLVLDRGALGRKLERRPHPLLGQAHAPRRQRGDLLGGLERAVDHARRRRRSPATSPMRSASSALTRRMVSISSWARDAPISRGSSQLTPMSQLETPMLRKAARSTALRAAKRMSLPSASASPKPGRRSVHRGDHGLRRVAQPQDQPRHVLLAAERVARGVRAVVARAPRRSRPGRRRRRTRAPPR